MPAKTIWVPPQEVINAAEALVDTATKRYTDTKADETFIHCLYCGEWEDHTDDCPIPTIQRWLDE